ncbi:MAG TPA: DUF2752 domain-containing protein [Stenomitos sp.]
MPDRSPLAFSPILTPFIQQIALCRIFVSVLGIHLGLLLFNLPSWPCPIRHGLGVPSPSCGLSRAIKALITGHWREALRIHSFAPFALGVGLFLAYVSIATPAQRHQIAQRLDRLERSTGLFILMGLLLVMYWLWRLMFLRTELYRLVM